MKALLSKHSVAADIGDALSGGITSSFATKRQIEERAKASFDAWWEGLGHVTRCEIDGFAAMKAFMAGYLSMASELGHLPEGGVE